MSVFVKGIDVPSDCDGCWHPTCNLWLQTDVGKRHKDCPIRPMPEKHGRLVDVDAIIAELKDGDAESGVKASGADLVVAILLAYLDSKPTIVEAEE